jgi:hypothetical protein
MNGGLVLHVDTLDFRLKIVVLETFWSPLDFTINMSKLLLWSLTLWSSCYLL